MLVVSEVLQGLHWSGLQWSERFAAALRAMSFFPSKAEKDT